MSKICVFRGWRAILNIHERALAVAPARASAVLESLSQPDDLLWPKELWPAMILDRGLATGSKGGHSIVRYEVSGHIPGRRVEFAFRPMPQLPVFRGRHYFEVLPCDRGVLLRHTIDVRTDFATWVYWKLFIERIHDALVEDAFDKAERSTGVPRPHHSRWPPSVRFLRWMRSRRRQTK